MTPADTPQRIIPPRSTRFHPIRFHPARRRRRAAFRQPDAVRLSAGGRAGAFRQRFPVPPPARPPGFGVARNQRGLLLPQPVRPTPGAAANAPPPRPNPGGHRQPGLQRPGAAARPGPNASRRRPHPAGSPAARPSRARRLNAAVSAQPGRMGRAAGPAPAGTIGTARPPYPRPPASHLRRRRRRAYHRIPGVDG